ncbi:MAG: phosphotransferase family protein [Phycisphaerales bacterium]|nr:phosphotransferase family protein [Phycisphaerales bacterium]
MSAAERIKHLPLWPAPPKLRRVAAGRTNENYVVECSGGRFFARVGTDLPEHGIQRRQEARIARLAADLDIAPKLHFAEDGLLVTDYITGRPLTAPEVTAAERLARIANLLRRLHQASPPSGLAPFDPMAVCRRYLDLLEVSALGESQRRQIMALLDQVPPLASTALIHADPVPENFIEDEIRRLWLVDWEYAGLGDPATDLAMLAMNCDLEQSAVATLVEAHGLCSCASVLQLRPVVAAREALWCLVQLQLRGPEGDLAKYAARCLGRLELKRQ